MPIHKTLNHHFFKKWSPEMAYVLGYFAADGSMIENKRGAHFVEFTTTDKGFFEMLQKVFNSNHKISKRPLRNKKWKQSYRLQVGSKEWFDDLSTLGFTPHKSMTLVFPRVPKRYLAEFILGYFDGDGCVYFKEHFAKDRNKKRWIFTSRFTSGSRVFLTTLLQRLRAVGVKRGFVLEKYDKSGFELVLSHNDSVALYEFMYNNMGITGLYLPRKLKIFKKAIKTLYKVSQ